MSQQNQTIKISVKYFDVKVDSNNEYYYISQKFNTDLADGSYLVENKTNTLSVYKGESNNPKIQAYKGMWNMNRVLAHIPITDAVVLDNLILMPKPSRERPPVGAYVKMADYKEECRCSCHQPGAFMMHMVACCDKGFNTVCLPFLIEKDGRLEIDASYVYDEMLKQKD